METYYLLFLMFLMGMIGIHFAYKKGRKDVIRGIKADIIEIDSQNLKGNKFITKLMDILMKLK